MTGGFSSKDILQAVERYHRENEGISQTDYRKEILEYNGEIGDNLDPILRILRLWKGYRWKNSSMLGEFLPRWVSLNLRLLEPLKEEQLFSLKAKNFVSILSLAGDLWDNGVPPTAYGKLLHFLLPRTILLWDQKYVRNSYNLDGDPYSFVKYQSFGQRLLEYLVHNEGKDVLDTIIKEHAKIAGYEEPLTKIIDEIVYYPGTSEKAITALGKRLALAPKLGQD